MDGYGMFEGCYNLTTFTSDLPSLMDGHSMFNRCDALTTFTSDLPSLTNGYYMFYGCDSLKSFSADLSSLTDGTYMFNGCPLASFSSDLASLKSGYYMFYLCKLNEASLRNIADTINDISDLDKDNKEHWTYEVLGKTRTINTIYRGRIEIGYNESVAQNVINECGNKLIAKGWTVYFNGNEFKK